MFHSRIFKISDEKFASLSMINGVSNFYVYPSLTANVPMQKRKVISEDMLVFKIKILSFHWSWKRLSIFFFPPVRPSEFGLRSCFHKSFLKRSLVSLFQLCFSPSLPLSLFFKSPKLSLNFFSLSLSLFLKPPPHRLFFISLAQCCWLTHVRFWTTWL